MAVRSYLSRTIRSSPQNVTLPNGMSVCSMYLSVSFRRLTRTCLPGSVDDR